MPFGSGTHTLSMWHHVNYCLDLYESDQSTTHDAIHIFYFIFIFYFHYNFFGFGSGPGRDACKFCPDEADLN